MSEVRQRTTASKESKNTVEPIPTKRSASELAKAEDRSPFSFLELARSIVFLLLASSALSYFVTRESFFWNVQRPNFTRLDVVKSWMVRSMVSAQSYTHTEC